MIHVYLDDMRLCPKGFVAARSAEECILLIEECEIGVLSLDFDLGWGQPDGLQVVHYIIAKGRYPQEIFLHTSSLSGKKAMYQLLYQNKPEGVQLVNGPMLHETLQKIYNTVQE
ncbi:cell division protein FtsJ [Paenibacillus sp. LMG 31456]|uniref:Cell division protein FtsJ n=1 Tax=Paenibacillus foliorum TaxID=2654974 RepID=A0A972GUI7_9BACL|nr:cyclic-phosphate processing receiver domain-containing protein [Paenibacillus foliorum]NOU96942.1 cell division protein FtsJ [Paenibacillus foliorum]